MFRITAATCIFCGSTSHISNISSPGSEPCRLIEFRLHHGQKKKLRSLAIPFAAGDHNHPQHESYRSADKSLARPGRKQARKHVRGARDFNNIETRAVVNVFFPLQGKAQKKVHAILTETLACFLPGRAKDLSAPLIITNGD